MKAGATFAPPMSTSARTSVTHHPDSAMAWRSACLVIPVEGDARPQTVHS